MPDPARIAQAQALEIPVIVQGAKTDLATGRRELFSENAKTILVFDNGALLHLQSRLTVGQAIFIHNQQNQREILCKVVETPAEGVAGYTNLEFTSADPEFWSDGSPKPREAAPAANPPAAAVAPPAPEAHPFPEIPPASPLFATPEAHDDNPLAMMSTTAASIVLAPVPSEPEQHEDGMRELLVPTHEMVQTAPPPDLPAVPDPIEPLPEPTGEQIDAALRQLSGLPPAAPAHDAAGAAGHAENVPEPDHAQAEANLAALMARDAKLAKYAATKDKAAKEIGRVKDSHGAANAASAAEAASEEDAAPAKTPWLQKLRTAALTEGRNAKILQIVMSVVIAAAIAVIVMQERKIFFPPKNPPVARQPKPGPMLPPKTAAAAPAPVAGAPANAMASSQPPASTPVPAAAKPPQPGAAPPASTSAANAAPVAPTSAAAKPAAVSSPPVEARYSERGSGSAPSEDSLLGVAPAQPKSRKASEETVPAKILQQPQPGLPAWAKSLDVDNVVKLDAVIDEKGNAKVAKVLSGPRALQHVAEEAIELWVFAPAQQNGKPVASHLTLTVEFQSQK